MEHFGRAPTSDELTHLKRELIHAVWSLLLDDEFKLVYTHGVRIECYDDIIRRFFPRFFCYSADYMEN